MVVVFERTSKHRRRAARLLTVAVTVTAAVAAAVAASAMAGEYHVYSCRTPSGESAPADGWSGSKAGAGAFAEDTCAQPGGALVAALGDDTPRPVGDAFAMWTFATPPETTLGGATFSRAGDAEGGAEAEATYQFWLAGPTETKLFDSCSFLSDCLTEKGHAGQPFSSANLVVEPSTNLGSHLYVRASCGGQPGFNCPGAGGDSNGYAAVVYLYAADLVLEQSAYPTTSNVSGELASAPTVGGTSDVAFSASDQGSGVYEAVFSVDGQVVQSTVLDENGGRCRNVGGTTDGLAAFVYVQPCPASVSADVGFDTTRVSNGTHHLVVSAIDAAGNAATVLDRNITVDNPTPAGARALGAQGGPNGRNASARATLAVRWKGTRRGHLTSGYGRAETIVGRLTGPGGVPIGAARVDAVATRAYAGATPLVMASPVTGADGRFSVSLPADSSSQTLRFAYSSSVGSSPVVTKTLTLSVRAGMTLSIAPRTASVGHSVHFSGRLRGGPIPAGGKLLVLEARSPGGAWLEFDVIHSDARGRYHANYRFKFPGPAAYQFRVLCEAEADYPFATGSSRVVGVLER